MGISSNARRILYKIYNQICSPGLKSTSGWANIYAISCLVSGSDILCQTIEHAGYRRNILRRNPKRYDEDGEELEDEDEDEEADARAAEENPYADVKIESKDIRAMAKQFPD